MKIAFKTILPSLKLSTSAVMAEAIKWGTLEELLLAYAVNRYGTSSWDSIAGELQKRMSCLVTPHICQQKYLDLKHRFNSTGICLDELRKLRVAELRRQLLRYDLSIVSLQLKVKRLKEERENLDLDTEPVKPDRIAEPVHVPEEESCDGSTNSKRLDHAVQPYGDQVRERVDSVELRESVAESKGGYDEAVKENSDVHSTASLSKREKKRREKKVMALVVSGNSSGEVDQSAATRATSDGKCQAGLVDFMEVVRARKPGSLFGGPLDGQASPRYKNLIRQHIDLGVIQRRLGEGQYSECDTKFYRDLMLLVNNVIIFFSNKTLEHKTALELRQLVFNQSRSHSNPHKSQVLKPSSSAPQPPKPPKSEPNSVTDDIVANLKPKLAITGPVIACRKRSSIAGKPASTGVKKEHIGEKPYVGEKTASSFNAVTKKRTRDQSIGSRSSSGKESSGNMRWPTPSPTASPAPKSGQKTPPVSVKGENNEAKCDKRKPKPGTSGSSSKVKQGSESGDGTLLDLLKNVTGQKSGNTNNISGGGNKGNKRKDNGLRSETGGKPGKGKGKGEEKEIPVSRNVGRLPKRAAALVATGKRGRDSTRETESLPKKRQRK